MSRIFKGQPKVQGSHKKNHNTVTPLINKQSSVLRLQKLQTYNKDYAQAATSSKQVLSSSRKADQKSSVLSKNFTDASEIGELSTSLFMRQTPDRKGELPKIKQIKQTLPSFSFLKSQLNKVTDYFENEIDKVESNMSNVSNEESFGMEKVDVEDVRFTGPSILSERDERGISKMSSMPSCFTTRQFGTNDKPSSDFHSLGSQNVTTPKGSKVRLRDYLFMVGTSASAAAKKKSHNLQAIRHKTILQSSLSSSCQQQQNMSIASNYNNEKYRINNQQIGTVLKRQLDSDLIDFIGKLGELKSLVSLKCDGVGKEDIAYMLELKRNLQEAKGRVGEAVERLRPERNIQGPSLVMVKVPGEEAYPLMGAECSQENS